MIIFKWWLLTTVMWRETQVWFDGMWIGYTYPYTREWQLQNKGTAIWVARNNERAFYVYQLYHDAIVQSLSLLVTVLFTTSNMTHKSVHTSFFKTSWNLAKGFALQFKVQPNPLTALWFFLGWEGRRGRGGNVAVMRAGVCRTVVFVSTCKL